MTFRVGAVRRPRFQYGEPDAMGLFKKRSNDADEIETLRREMAGLRARLDASQHEKQALGVEVRKLAVRVDKGESSPTAVIEPAEIEDLRSRIQGFAARLDSPTPKPPPPPSGVSVDGHPGAPASGDPRVDDVVSRLDQLGDRLDQVDGRITSISTELARQIDELSGDIGDHNGAIPADDLVTELRDSQERLANEQARYQIAFRQDLADLADRLRRPT